MTKRRVHLRVSFILPPSAVKSDARNYVIDAVRTMKGCYRPPGGFDENDPGDPMFDLDADTVEVRMLREKGRK